MAKIKIISEVKSKVKVLEAKKEENLEEEIGEIEQDSINARFHAAGRLTPPLLEATEGAQETPQLQQPTERVAKEENPAVTYATVRTREEDIERKYGLQRSQQPAGTQSSARTAGIIRREAPTEIERGRVFGGDRTHILQQGQEEDERYEAKIPKHETSTKRKLPWE